MIDDSLHLGAGYDRYSMSNNARSAYRNGERPISKWTKADLLNAAEAQNSALLPKLNKLSVSELRRFLLEYTGYHHTSSRYNRTEFYGVREDFADLSPDDVPEHRIERKAPVVRYRGSIHYVVWSGTKNHPKATEKDLTDIWIEERGSFYVVIDDDGNELVRKKIGSNGTIVRNYEREEAEKRRHEEYIRTRTEEIRQSSGNAAADLYTSFCENGGISESQSGNIYLKGRKPSPVEYEMGIEKFFKKGEKCLLYDPETDSYSVQVFNGRAWESAKDAEN